MSNAESLLGRTEGPDLEFKGAKVLENLDALSRAVVGMLNAEGGSVWVGVEEKNERAVDLTPIPDPERSIRRIEDHLADVVEPGPRGEEVSIRRVPTAEGGEILEIRVHPDKGRGPFAVVRGNAWRFPVRVGARNRPMSRGEVFEDADRERDAEEEAKARLLEEREQVRADGFSGMLLLIMPVGEVSLPVSGRKLYEYFRDPHRTGNRPGGWTFANPFIEPRHEAERLVFDEISSAQTTVHADGRIRFTAASSCLEPPKPEDRGRNAVWPYSLCEFPVSVFRLAKTLHTAFGSRDTRNIVADLSLHRLQGWELRPFSPDAIGYRLEKGKRLERDDILEKPLTLPRDEFLDNPDRCARRLVLRVYNGFGYSEEHLPRQFQNDEHRFITE